MLIQVHMNRILKRFFDSFSSQSTTLTIAAIEFLCFLLSIIFLNHLLVIDVFLGTGVISHVYFVAYEYFKSLRIGLVDLGVPLDIFVFTFLMALVKLDF